MPDPRPLWRQLADYLAPDDMASMLDRLADVIEWRGDSRRDVDPGETAEWLRWEAIKALERSDA